MPAGGRLTLEVTGVNMDQIRYFITIADCGSILEASRRLHITQPTLSRQVTGIEQELGLQLFLRNRHGIRLTPAGETLYSRWSTLMELYQQAVQDALLTSRGKTETLYIGILDGLKIGSYFPAFLSDLQRHDPNTQIVLQRHSYGELISGLWDGSLDLAFSLSVGFLGHPELELQNIKHCIPTVGIPASNPLAKRERISIPDLREETIALVNREECETAIDMFIRLCQREGGFVPKLQFVPALSNVLLWMEAGLCCAMLNSELNIRDSELVRIFRLEDKHKSFVQMAFMGDSAKRGVALARKYYAGYPL